MPPISFVENFVEGGVSGLALTLVMLLRAESGQLVSSQDRDFPGFCILVEIYRPTQLNCANWLLNFEVFI